MQNNHALAYIITSIFLLYSAQVLTSQTDANIPIKGICIYIDYPDAPANVTPAQLEGMINDMNYQETGINRSFRKYWHQETRRNFDLQHDIFYYTAPQSTSFYSNLQWFEGIDLWREALEAIIAENPDYDWDALSKWSTTDVFDPNSPGFLVGGVKSTFVISSAYGPAGLGAAHYPQWTLSNGELIGTIQGSTLQRPWDATLNLFTLCHESGHAVFNLPDTYDYDASSGGTAKYSVMSAQGPDVEPVGAPFLYQHNWGHVLEPAPGTHTITLRADGDSLVVIKNIHDEREFFSFEVRKNTSLGNSLFPVPLGLLIWHSDLKVHTGNNLEDATRYAHYKHSVIQKDGFLELENSGPSPPINSGDIYVEGDLFNDTSTPNTKWWSGEASGIEVKDIQLIDGEHVRFTVIIPEAHEEHFDFIAKSEWTLISETPAQHGFDGTKAFDNDLSTYYHVPFGSNQSRPHELVIDLGAEYEINEFYYTANDNFSPPWEGRIMDYELSFSMDGIDWGTPIVAEQFFRTLYRQYAIFPKTLTRFIRISAINSFGDDSRTSIAEIDFRGKKPSTTNTHGYDQEFLSNLKISPNPTTDFLVIEGLKNDLSIKVFSTVGKLMTELKNPASFTYIDLSTYPIGSYILTISDAQNKLLLSKNIIKVD